MFWIDTKFGGHCPCIESNLSSHITMGTNNLETFDALSRCLCLTSKERDVAYEQQCDAILKPKHLRLQVLSIIFDDTTFLCQIHEILKKDLFAIAIQGQSRSHNQVHDFSMIMLCLSFKMVYFIVMVFCLFLMAMRDFKFSKLGTMFGYRPFWIQQNHGVSVLKLLVVIALEVCEGICWILHCLCSSKESSSSLHGLL